MHWLCWPSSSIFPTTYRNVRPHPTPTSSDSTTAQRSFFCWCSPRGPHCGGGDTISRFAPQASPRRSPAGHWAYVSRFSSPPASRWTCWPEVSADSASQPTRSTGCGFWRRDICHTLDSNGPLACSFCMARCGSRICFMATSRRATTRSGPSRRLPGSHCSSPPSTDSITPRRARLPSFSSCLPPSCRRSSAWAHTTPCCATLHPSIAY